MDIKEVRSASDVSGPECSDQAKAESAVRNAIADDLCVSVGTLKVKLETNSKQWPDTSLGVPKDGEIYAQILTEGFRVQAQANGTWYVFHTNTEGNVRLASKVSKEDADALTQQVLKDFKIKPENITSLTAHTVPPSMLNPRPSTVFTVTARVDGAEKVYKGTLGKLEHAPFGILFGGGRLGPGFSGGGAV